MRRYNNSVVQQFDTQESGNAGAGTPITVRNQDNSLASIFADSGVTPLDNPLRADDKGNYFFYVADGTYNLILEEGTPRQVTVSDVQIFDQTVISPLDFVYVPVTEGQTVVTLQRAVSNVVVNVNGATLINTKPNNPSYTISEDGMTLTFTEAFKGNEDVEVWFDPRVPASTPDETNGLYATRTEAIADTTLAVGDVVLTFGYNTIGDAGGAKYIVVAETETVAPFGDATLANNLKLILQMPDRYRAECWGLFDDDTMTVNQQANFVAFRDDAFNKRYTMQFPEGQFLLDQIDLKNLTRIGLRGAGMEKTTFRASGSVDLSAGAFLDCGITGNDFTPVDSDIQFADIGDFTIRANGNTILYGCSFNNFRRGNVERIRCFDMQNGYRYGYSWLDIFSHLFSEQHVLVGHRFDNASTNALTFTNLVATSNVASSKGYDFINPQTITLISPDCEGSGHTIGFDFSNGRAVTLINPHMEGAGSTFSSDNFNSNGMDLKIVGGASFNAPNTINFTGAMESLNIDSFALHDIGTDTTGLDIQVNARNTVLNISAYLDDNTPVTQEQLIDAITIGSFCDSVTVNGQQLLSSGTIRTTEFGARVNPVNTVPVNIPMAGGAVLPRRSYKIWATTRLSDADTAAIQWLAVINDNDEAIITEIVEIKNSIAGLQLAYNQFDNLFTIEANSTAGVDFSIIELD